MRLIMLGINHRTADVAQREALALGGERLGPTLAAFRERFPGAEAVLLCTCNRTELYVAPGSGDATGRGAKAQAEGDGGAAVDAAELRKFLAARAGLAAGALDHAAERQGGDAVHHLMRVTAGLDAMAVGESQVLGQVRRAYDAAKAAGTVGPVLHHVMQRALAGARRARRESGVDRLEHSVSSMAVAVAGGVFESLAGKTVAGVGAGEITKVTLARMLRQDPPPGAVWVVNRSAGRAAALAAGLGLGERQQAAGSRQQDGVDGRSANQRPAASGQRPGIDASPAARTPRLRPSDAAGSGVRGGVRPWGELANVLVEADLVVTGTAAAEPIVTAAMFAGKSGVLRRRRHRPLLVIDLAVPRDVEAAVGDLPGVYLYNIDDLERALDESPERRERVARCEALIEAAAARCVAGASGGAGGAGGGGGDVGALARQLRGKLRAIGEAESRRTRRKLANLRPVQPDGSAPAGSEAGGGRRARRPLSGCWTSTRTG